MYKGQVATIVFFQAEDGIRDLVRSRGLGDVYKRQGLATAFATRTEPGAPAMPPTMPPTKPSETMPFRSCLLYTSDAADERSSVDLGGRRIIKKKRSSRYLYR